MAISHETVEYQAPEPAEAPADPPAQKLVLPNGVQVWIVSGHEHVKKALRDPRLSKSAAGLTAIMQRQLTAAGQSDELSGMFAPHMLFSDGDEHKRLKDLVVAKFTRKRIEAMRPQVAQLVDDLLDALPTDQPVDLIEQVAFPLPLSVLCELLGVPADDLEQLRTWTSTLMEALPSSTIAASRALESYFLELIAAKRERPGDDLLSALVSVAHDEDRLSAEELMATAFLLIVAGHETTINAIGNCIGAVLQTPDLWRTLSQQPDLLAGTVEELLRFDSPVPIATHRYTREPIDIGGVHIPSDEIVLVSLHSANRDKTQFDHADQFDVHRQDASSHIAFGYGAHFCLGAALARVETTMTLGALTRRFPDAVLAVEPDQLRRRESVIVNGYAELPVRLAP
jgi:cytochrome P450